MAHFQYHHGHKGLAENLNEEHVTVIPKKTVPESINDLRNILCTALPSKVYESYVLNWVQEEVRTKSNQFGGVKGCSTAHFLI